MFAVTTLQYLSPTVTLLIVGLAVAGTLAAAPHLLREEGGR
jgi:hypothetical protein